MSELTQRLFYRVGNPSAWPEGFDESGSELFREAVSALEAQEARIKELEEALQGSLDKMEFTWQELDAQHGLCRNVMDVPPEKLWKEIRSARNALSKAPSIK